MSIPRSPHYNRVLEFMLRAKQDCPLVPTMPSDKVRELRARLILEEALETIEALGFRVKVADSVDEHEVSMATIVLKPTGYENLIELVDGCADLSVVTVGTLIAAGVKDVPVLECVDENNLQKFSEGHRINEFGKLIKPPNHRPPDIARVLREQDFQPALVSLDNSFTMRAHPDV